MCGIFLSCFSPSSVKLQLQALERRGPDHNAHLSISDLAVYCWSSVLCMRSKFVPQPFENKHCVLLFNGEIFYDDWVLSDVRCDTELFYKHMSNVARETEKIAELVSTISGPYSFVFIEKTSKKIWFGRDCFGRRSLLWAVDGDALIISSTAIEINANMPQYSELPFGTVFELSLDGSRSLTAHTTVLAVPETEDKMLSFLDACRELSINCVVDEPTTFLSRGLFEHNRDSLHKDQNSHKKFANVAEAADFYLADRLETVNEFLQQLRAAVARRIVNSIPKLCKFCKRNASVRASCSHSKIAILFSGGVDSTILAALADEFIAENESIDLINVAFEQSEKAALSNGKRVAGGTCFDVPDRQTGLVALQELRTRYSKRRWNFIHANVTQEELRNARQRQIVDLVLPKCTVLDDSIGCVLWFAARGQGNLMPLSANDGFNAESYESSACALFLGTGADELLGGYSRHRLRYIKAGREALINELEMELGRLPYRNLGRDDRVISDHGVESRLPFLDERFVSFVNALPLESKMNFELPRGLGEKLLLRLALWKLGFRQTALNPKRAMQFGSRIAKLEDASERASDLCSRLLRTTVSVHTD